MSKVLKKKNTTFGRNCQHVIEMQGWPLDRKIAKSRQLIRQWHNHWGGNVSISFSGGMDSTVLLHLARSIYPNLVAHFVDTGLEYPSVKAFAKSQPNVEVVRPKLTFRQVIEKHGYPVISKRVSQYVKEVKNAKGETATKRLRLTGVKSDGKFNELGMIPRRWQYLCAAPFKISDRCCHVLKKAPLKGISYPMLGMRVEEGHQRVMTHLLVEKQGEPHGHALRTPHTSPLFFWRDLDIWEYVESRGLEYADCYKGENAVERTGCMFCMFGIHLDREPNRFQLMAITHPKQYDYCINKLGLGEVLDYLRIPYGPPKQMEMFK